MLEVENKIISSTRDYMFKAIMLDKENEQIFKGYN